MKQPQTYQDHIKQDSRILAGKPVVAGTRIPVERVVAHLTNNPRTWRIFSQPTRS